MHNSIKTFVYGFKPYLKEFIKVQVQAIADAFLIEVITVALKLEYKAAGFMGLALAWYAAEPL